MLNKVQLIGRVGQDPEVREVNGTKVAYSRNEDDYGLAKSPSLLEIKLRNSLLPIQYE